MVKVPSQKTLDRYGLDVAGWLAILTRQDGKCFVCEREPTTGRLCTDHEHVKGWSKMPPGQRVLYVRGLLCFFCNHYYLARAITSRKAARVLLYLNQYEARKA